MKKILAVMLLAATLVTLFCIPTSAEDARVQNIPMQILADSSNVYKDINAEAWYKSAIDGVVGFGLIDGIDGETFSPNDITDRATLVTALYRMTGEPEVSKEVPFVDLTKDWYKAAVAWAYETGVVNGTSTTTFSPDTKITREQMAAIFYRYMSYMGGNTKSVSDLTVYPDAKKVSSYATDAFSWACAEGLITGSKGADGVVRLDPKEGATRAQVATIVMRFAEKYQNIFEIADNPAEDDNFKLFDNSGIITHMQSNFSVKDPKHMLVLYHATRWKFSKANGVYIIKENDVEIGRLYPGIAPDLDEWKIVSIRNSEKENVSIYEYIEKYGSGVTLRFRYRYSFEYEEDGKAQSFTLTLDYTKITAQSAQRILDYTKVENLYTDPGYSKLSSLKDKNIYFVGNSFIGYSKIPYILEEMARKNGKSLGVGHIWLPNTRIVDFAKNSDILSTIRSGKYDAIFLCGMYLTADSTAIDVIKNACDKAGVELILFPAHNENAAIIQATQARHPDLKIINWKSEIELLINDGRDYWDFCYNDGPRHSNEIAGYVGAHMIYRAIYGENSTVRLSEYVNQANVNKVLGSYVTEPSMRRVKSVLVNHFE